MHRFHFIAIAFALLLSGCGAKMGALTLRSEKPDSIPFTQPFKQAYASLDENGMYEFVLIADDASAHAAVADPTKPIKPAGQTPLRQVVYVKVLWRPAAVGLNEEPVTANASINWYVMTNTPGGEGDLLEYQGAGFVLVSPDDNTTTLDIRSAHLKPTITRGGLVDPVGPARVVGRIKAVNNPTEVKDLIAATRQRTSTVAHAGQ